MINFIFPDRLVDRKKEEHSLFGLLNEAVVDQFSAQISLFGLKGVGKTVLINKSLKKMTET
jgi:Cdc6-like AAA superfamily ATPase